MIWIGNNDKEQHNKVGVYVLVTVLVIGILIIIPKLNASDYVIYVLAMSMIYAILAGSYDLLTGYTGPLTFCHGAFFGIGAYASALMVLKLKMSFWLALPLSGVVVFIFAFIIGLPVLRLRGHYFAVTTFFLGYFIYLIFLNSISLTNGPMGLRDIPAPNPLFGIKFDTIARKYYLMLFYTIIVVGVLYVLVKSNFGRILKCIRENDDLAEFIGINTSYYKVLSLSISAGIAGLTGSMFAHFFGLLHPETFSWMTSEMIVIMALVGGLGTLFGPLIGAGVVTAILEIMRFAPEFRYVVWSAILIIVLIYEPKGIMGIIMNLRRK